MIDDEPHKVEDNDPAGEATISRITIRRKKRKKVIVAVKFDDSLKEFELWDHLYDIKTSHFDFEATPDFENRVQYYEITADILALSRLRLWLMKNKYKYTIKNLK